MSTPIRAALKPKSTLLALVKDGIAAVKKEHRTLIEPNLRGAFADSTDIDEAFRGGAEQENRWDYLLGHRQSRALVALEPHTANNHEVTTVIRKRQAALEHLRPHLKEGARVTEWLWVASGRVDFLPLDKATLRLGQNGIKFVGRQVRLRDLPKRATAR